MAGTSDPSSANLDMSNSSVNNETIENSMFKKMFDEYRAKDEQISRLTVEIEELKRENLKLKAQQSVKMPEQSINIRNCDPKQKAQELKNALNKVVDDILSSHEHPNRPHYVNRQQLVPSSTAIIPHVDVNHSLVDIDDNISKNTNNVPISHAPPLLNSSFMSHEPPIPEYQVRPSNDQEVINQATTPLISHFTPLSDGRLSYPPLPQSPPRRTNNSVNNNNHNYYNNNINPNNNNNNNNNKSNKKNKPDKPSGYSQAKHTIFIAWTGSMTLDGLKSLFRTEDVDDIRFLPNKQFAHVDLKTEAGLKRALELNDQVKSPEQGKLRVELGKPRATSSTENNGQRSQQNKPNYRPNNNNNNNNKQNGYNPQQKHQNKYTSQNGYMPNNYNSHSQEEIRSINKWHSFSNSESQGTISNIPILPSENKSNNDGM